MFTGIVEELGTVRRVLRSAGYRRFFVVASKILENTKIGDSIAVNGVCQTVVDMTESGFVFETLEQTLRKTTIGNLRPPARVNLERAARLDTRLGGHLVQGHVEGVGKLVRIVRRRENVYAHIDLPARLAAICLTEGSVALDGVSLTIARVRGREIVVNLIPQTVEATIWKTRRPGDLVNVETDILRRYAAQEVSHRGVVHEERS